MRKHAVSALFFMVLGIIGIGCFFLDRIVTYYRIRPSGVLLAVVGKTYSFSRTNGKTAVLLLGVPGGEHDGNDLTDSMIVAELDSLNNHVTLLSLPRDIWAPTIQDKINSIYHYGELSENGTGMEFTKKTVGDLIGVPIQYAVKIDFSGFSRLVDAVGGVTVDVPESFTDEWYPIAGKENDVCGGDPEYRCRYETLVFRKGPTRMDGNLALKYVRSRHSEGSEGTDFARGKRQQDVLDALKKRLTDIRTYSSISVVRAVVSTVLDTVSTDMGNEQALEMGIALLRIPKSEIEHRTIDDLLREGETADGRYILNPAHPDMFQNEVSTRLLR